MSTRKGTYPGARYLRVGGESAPFSKPGHCVRCGKKLDQAKTVGLELDQRVDEYHDFGGIPDNQNQGGFEFGPDCAEILRQRARIALDVIRQVPAARVKAKKMKRASYRDGVAWIALNDEPLDRDAASVAGYISTCLLADLFEVPSARVAADIVRYREKA